MGMMWGNWSDRVNDLAREIIAQAQRFAENHLASDTPATITRIDNPEMPGQFTFVVEQVDEPLLLIDINADHVLEEAAKVTARPGLILEGIRRAARTVYIDPHLAGPLQLALARTG